MAWLQEHYLVLLLIVSEILPLIPGIESNSVGQLVINGLKMLLSSEKKPAA